MAATSRGEVARTVMLHRGSGNHLGGNWEARSCACVSPERSWHVPGERGDRERRKPPVWYTGTIDAAYLSTLEQPWKTPIRSLATAWWSGPASPRKGQDVTWVAGRDALSSLQAGGIS